MSRSKRLTYAQRMEIVREAAKGAASSELAERFGVSRTPVREALQRLETQSLLARDGRSLIVASLDHNQMSELYVVRRELEGLAASLAARHATQEEVRILREMVEEDDALVCTHSRMEGGEGEEGSGRRLLQVWMLSMCFACPSGPQ